MSGFMAEINAKESKPSKSIKNKWQRISEDVSNWQGVANERKQEIQALLKKYAELIAQYGSEKKLKKAICICKSQESRAKNLEPSIKSQVSRANYQEPRIKSQESSAKYQEPRIKSQMQVNKAIQCKLCGVYDHDTIDCARYEAFIEWKNKKNMEKMQVEKAKQCKELVLNEIRVQAFVKRLEEMREQNIAKKQAKKAIAKMQVQTTVQRKKSVLEEIIMQSQLSYLNVNAETHASADLNANNAESYANADNFKFAVVKSKMTKKRKKNTKVSNNTNVSTAYSNVLPLQLGVYPTIEDDTNHKKVNHDRRVVVASTLKDPGILSYINAVSYGYNETYHTINVPTIISKLGVQLGVYQYPRSNNNVILGQGSVVSTVKDPGKVFNLYYHVLDSIIHSLYSIF